MPENQVYAPEKEGAFCKFTPEKSSRIPLDKMTVLVWLGIVASLYFTPLIQEHNMPVDASQLFEKYLSLGIDYGIKIVTAIIIVIAGRWAARIISNFIKKQMNARGIDPMVSGFVQSLLYWGIFAFAGITALGELGVHTTSFVAILGAAGLAIGLALQGSLSNFASGILILIFKPFKTGDYIEAAGTAGSVNEIRIFSTLLTTSDNKLIIIPNNAITSSSITNYSAKDTRRVDLTVRVSHDAHLPDVRKLLEAIVAADAQVLKEASNLIAVSAITDSSVNFLVRVWVKSSDYWPVYYRLTETIKLKLDENKIKTPTAQIGYLPQ